MAPLRTAPDCAIDHRSISTAPLATQMDAVAAWAAVAAHPDCTQRTLLDNLVPVMGRARARAAIAEAVAQGWLELSHAGKGCSHRHNLVGQDMTWETAVDAALSVLTDALASGWRLSAVQRRGIRDVLRGVQTMQVPR